MKKILGGIIIFLGIGRSVSHAFIWDHNSDCSLVNATGGNFGAIVNQRTGAYTKLIPLEAVKQALLNLKAHCCTEVANGENDPTCIYDTKKAILPENYAHSKYLFDHLLDINLRRLDGIENLIYNGVELDKKGRERREKVDLIAEGGAFDAGTIATIQKTQEDERTTPQGEKMIEFETTKLCERKEGGETTNKFTEMAEDYENKNLIRRYQNQCAIVACAYYNLTDTSKRVLIERYYHQCEKLIATRISNEKTYIKTVMENKAVDQLQEVNQKYLGTYFVESRFMNLWKLLFEFVDAFSTVTRSVTEGTKMCN